MKKHLLEAAGRGDAEAQFNLGVMYENGLDDNHHAVQGNRPEAEKWFTAAAEQGLPRAQVKLAEFYADSPEMPQHGIKACGWFLVAITRLRGAQLESAQSAYRRASARLTPAQIAEVRNFAEGWEPEASIIIARADQLLASNRESTS